MTALPLAHPLNYSHLSSSPSSSALNQTRRSSTPQPQSDSLGHSTVKSATSSNTPPHSGATAGLGYSFKGGIAAMAPFGSKISSLLSGGSSSRRSSVVSDAGSENAAGLHAGHQGQDLSRTSSTSPAVAYQRAVLASDEYSTDNNTTARGASTESGPAHTITGKHIPPALIITANGTPPPVGEEIATPRVERAQMGYPSPAMTDGSHVASPINIVNGEVTASSLHPSAVKTVGRGDSSNSLTGSSRGAGVRSNGKENSLSIDAGGKRSRSPSIQIIQADNISPPKTGLSTAPTAGYVNSSSTSASGISTPSASHLLSMTSPLRPATTADDVLLKSPSAPGTTTSARRLSNASRHSAMVGLGGAGGTGMSSSQSMQHVAIHSPGLSSSRSALGVPAPPSPGAPSGIHSATDVIEKVKHKVRSRRGSRRHDDGDDDDGDHVGRREKIKRRLRGYSDATSGTHSNPHSRRYSNASSLGRSLEEDDDESDTSDDDGEYSDDDAHTSRSEVSRMSLPVTGFAVASNKRNQDFHAMFPQIDSGDYLIEDYGCALQKDILVHGRIYVSEHHLSFHSNILGWITNLVIAFGDITAIEKRMTAFVIPNGISITTRQGKQYIFASFIARDSTFDVFINVWRQAHSRSPSVYDEEAGPGEVVESPTKMSVDGAPPMTKGGAAASAAHTATTCACGQKGEHYPEVAMQATFPSTPENIYNLMFTSQFMKQFMAEDEKLMDISMGDWTPLTPGSKLLKRNFSYIKPLNGGIGPKQTKCELTDEMDHCDNDNYISMATTTRTPDVPSGNVFSVKTRTCLMWAGAHSTKVVVSTKVEWTGRSFIKGIIEKSAVDGQKTYHHDLEKAMRKYIKDHSSEFFPAGQDESTVCEEFPPEPAQTTTTAVSTADLTKQQRKADEANAFQAALDSVMRGITSLVGGIFGLIKTSFEVLGELPLTKESLFGAVIFFLLVSNIWTYTSLQQTRKSIKAEERRLKRESRVGSPVKSTAAPAAATSAAALQSSDIALAVRAYFEGSPVDKAVRPVADIGEDVRAILLQLEGIEQRIGQARLDLVKQGNKARPASQGGSAEILD